MTAIAPTNIFNITSGTSANWIADVVVANQNQTDTGLIGALSTAAKYKPGSIGAFLNSTSSTDLANIAQSSVTAATQFAIQQGDAVTQARSAAAAQQTLNDLSAASNTVQPTNVLDPIIYLGDGGTLDTNANILTLSNGTQIDATTGALYTDPASIVQLANGAYLDTQNNILTLGDGTRIDSTTGLTISKTA
jgi:hypothetical protein